MITDIFQPSEAEANEYIDAYIDFYRVKSGKPLENDGSNGGQLKEEIEREARADLLNDLYKNLDTLDGKASGILSYCGLILAGASLLVTGGAPNYLTVAALMAFVAATSALFALSVIFVRWTPAEKLKGRTLHQACRELFRIRTARTRIYLVSWTFILLATLALAAYLLIALWP